MVQVSWRAFCGSLARRDVYTQPGGRHEYSIYESSSSFSAVPTRPSLRKGEPRLIALQPSIACSLPRRGDTDLERRIFARIASQAERRRYDHRNLARTGSAIRVSQPYDVLRLRCTETQSPGDAGAHGRPPAHTGPNELRSGAREADSHPSRFRDPDARHRREHTGRDRFRLERRAHRARARRFAPVGGGHRALCSRVADPACTHFPKRLRPDARHARADCPEALRAFEVEEGELPPH